MAQERAHEMTETLSSEQRRPDRKEIGALFAKLLLADRFGKPKDVAVALVAIIDHCDALQGEK
jgi:hypothetical protein